MTETLKPGEAHVWYLMPDQVMNPGQLERYHQLLSQEERTQNESFRFPPHRHSHLLTRAFVRILLSRYGDVKPLAWQFAKNSYGKPGIAGPEGAPAIAFNISHTEGLITCVIAAAESTVGIDAENLRPTPDCLQIAEKHFSAAEYSDLCSQPEPNRIHRFFEYWTLKEAYVKARGIGISMNLSEFTFHMEEEIRISFHGAGAELEKPISWQFRLWEPGGRYIVAVAIQRAAGVDVEFSMRDGASLME